MDDFDRRFEKTFAMVAFATNRHLVDHMRRLITLLDMDIESAMLWGLVAHLGVAHAMHPGALPSDLLAPDGFMFGEARPVRLADLVQVSGLPKETVRRKLQKLHERGKLERNEDGRWIALRSGVDETAYEFTRESVKRLLQTARTIEGILQHARLD
jgi:DNA-binding transcriptional ArsR family regulator